MPSPNTNIDDLEITKVIEQVFATSSTDEQLKLRLVKNFLALLSAAKLEEAKWWEYNIIPAVRSKQVEHDVNKRLKELKESQ